MAVEALIEEFAKIAANPKRQLAAYKAEGKKAIGVMPYYVPEEIIYAGGAVPMGMWGSNTKTIRLAKEYCLSFYCSLCQIDLEMMLDGTCDQLDGVVTPTMCDTLRPMSQNVKCSVGDKIRPIFLAHPQVRKTPEGKEFCRHQYENLKNAVEEITGNKVTDEALENAIKVYNRSRAARRKFVVLAGQHPDVISAVNRSAVLKAAYFELKDTYTERLEKLNAELEKLPAADWKGTKVVTSGIICDNPELLKLFDTYHIAIVADDVAHESRAIQADADENTADPMKALVEQWAKTGPDPMLYDDAPTQHIRSKALIRKARKAGADGVIIFMMQFCDPEETDYPYLKQDLDIADLPNIKLGYDQQMRDFGQASTSLQAFNDVLELHKNA